MTETSPQDPERRTMLRNLAVGSAIAWTAPAILTTTNAVAAASLVNTCPGAGTIDWSTFTPTAGPSMTGPWSSKVMGTSGGTTVTFFLGGSTAPLRWTGTTPNYTAVWPSNLTGGYSSYFRLQKQGPAPAGSTLTLTMSFSQPVCNLNFKILDIDWDASATSTDPFADRVTIQPFKGSVARSGTFTPDLGSGPTTLSPPGVQTGTTVTYDGASSANVPDASKVATLDVSITDRVDKVVITYVSAVALPTSSAAQHIAFTKLTWS